MQSDRFVCPFQTIFAQSGLFFSSSDIASGNVSHALLTDGVQTDTGNLVYVSNVAAIGLSSDS